MEEVKQSLELFEKIMEKVAEEPADWPDSATFLSLDVAIENNLFNSHNLELVKFLKQNDVGSISDLAEKLDKSSNTISKNISKLEQYGVVNVEKDGRKKVPILNEDHIIILF